MIALTTFGIRWMNNGTGKCSNGSMSKSQTKHQKRHRTRRSQLCIFLGRVKKGVQKSCFTLDETPVYGVVSLARLRRPETSSFMNGMTAIYVRVSTDDQRLDSQQRELKRFCQQRSWKDLHFYEDKMSGTKASRPALDQMMTDLRAGKL